MNVSTNKHNNGPYKNLSDMVINTLNVVKMHIEIPGLLGLVGNFLQPKFDPKNYEYIFRIYSCSNESDDQYVRVGSNFYETFDFPIEFKRTNHKFKMLYYLLHKVRPKEYKHIFIGIVIQIYNEIGYPKLLHFVLPIEDIIQISEITQYEKFHKCCKRYEKLFNSRYNHYSKECPIIDEIHCKELWHVWNCEVKLAITYFIKCREKLIQAGTIPQNGSESLAWTQKGYESKIKKLKNQFN